MTVETNLTKRWEEGTPHHPKSEEVERVIKELDTYGLFEFGGDGDNGEDLLYMLDVYFERKDES